MKKKLQPAITLLQQYMVQDMTVYAGHATLFLLTAFFPLLMWLLVLLLQVLLECVLEGCAGAL